MTIEQIYTGCLAQGAYYIVSNGEAAIIDPLRETQPYIDRLTKDGVKLKYVFETHFHADFVSGHLDLSKRTGATIVYGPTALPQFDCKIATDGELFGIGNIQIRAIHTPGHTMESTCYLLIDEGGTARALFSGDTLFLGDVGRPDLAQKATHMTQEDLAGLLYESLNKKILPLGDDIIVYPAHGAGSACGKNMMKETLDTLGNQKRLNYALNQPDKESFIKAVLEGLTPPPAYFAMNVAMNKSGYKNFDEVLAAGLRALTAAEVEAVVATTEAVVLDTRDASAFSKAFIPRSINIGIQGDFAPWVGAMLGNVSQPIVLVCDEGREQECVTRLTRVGFDNVLGYLQGGIAAWEAAGKETDSVNRIEATTFATQYKAGASNVIDVRKESEFVTEHVYDATNNPLSQINEWMSSINNKEHFYLHCAGGYRSMIAASILQARGLRNFSEVAGGYNAIAKTDVVRAAGATLGAE